MQFTSSCKLHLLPLYTHIFIRMKQRTFRKLIRFFVIMISCMRCDFAERYLYLLCCFLHMCRILAGKRCLGPPHTCHPFFHTFVIITDLYCRILMLFRPAFIAPSISPATLRIFTPSGSQPLPDFLNSSPSGVRITQPNAYLPMLFSKLPST